VASRLRLLGCGCPRQSAGAGLDYIIPTPADETPGRRLAPGPGQEAALPDPSIVLTTTGSAELAEKIAAALVERRLAACVNIVGPLRSVYRWQGQVERAEERLLLIKTTAERFQAVRATIRELHTYELPEVLAWPITQGDESYLAWLAHCVAPGGGDRED